jgi:metalloendopeptidase OMA1, mitochondrial
MHLTNVRFPFILNSMNASLRHISCWILGVSLFLSGCYTVPETGRRSLQLIPIGQELAMGASAFNELRQHERVSTDAQAIAMVERVGQRIALQAADDMPGAEWEFVVFDGDDTINAFALPGGKVGVYTGILRLAETEDALAAVIGHEIAHVTARHGTERMSRALGLAAVGVGLGVATRDQDAQTRDAIMIAYGLGATVGVELPYSRLAENEADEIGLYYAARAGYDPRAAIGFWERMGEHARGRARPPEFLSTHPTDETRIARLQQIMPQALIYYEEATGQRISSR